MKHCHKAKQTKAHFCHLGTQIIAQIYENLRNETNFSARIFFDTLEKLVKMEQNMDEICMELKRKELQYVAKNFLESKANAKSETIVQEIKNYALIGEEEYEKMIHFLANLPKELKLQTPKSTKKTRIVDSSARRSIRASTRKLDKIVVEEESHDDVRKELNLHDEDSDMDENVENSIVEPEEEKSIEMELVKELCPSTCSPCEMDVPEMKGQDASCPMDQDKDDAGCNGTMGDVAINDSEVKSAQQVDSENFVEKDKSKHYRL